MAYDLQLSHIGKVYDNGTPAVIDFNLVQAESGPVTVCRHNRLKAEPLVEGAAPFQHCD